jgi:hypothetical protein
MEEKRCCASTGEWGVRPLWGEREGSICFAEDKMGKNFAAVLGSVYLLRWIEVIDVLYLRQI